VFAQDAAEPEAPELPSLAEIEAGRLADPDFIPTDFSFRVGVVGNFEQPLETSTGVQTQIKTPLLLLDPRTGEMKRYAQNFPARIVANSTDGNWVVGVAPSSAVEGSSGSRGRECAVSLNLREGTIELIKEFPLHSDFQAVFADNDNNAIFYCVNEPAAENSIIRYNLESEESEVVPAEGNRFTLYGLKREPPRGMWVEDSFNLEQYPVLRLIDLEGGAVLSEVRFPGASEVIVSPDGSAMLVVVSASAESSVGYYMVADDSFHQVSGLVLTRPTFQWAHRSLSVVAKESTTTRDRFLWVDLVSGEYHELFNAYFKIGQWDVSPDDEGLVFINDTPDAPQLFVVPLDPEAEAINRVRLRSFAGVSWIGCLYPPREGGGSWLDRLLPF
jgi:hypothetical protein